MKKRILIAEFHGPDGPNEMMKLYGARLEAENHSVTVSNGRQAIRQLEAGTPWDLVLVTPDLGHFDGFEVLAAARSIRKRAWMISDDQEMKPEEVWAEKVIPRAALEAALIEGGFLPQVEIPVPAQIAA